MQGLQAGARTAGGVDATDVLAQQDREVHGRRFRRCHLAPAGSMQPRHKIVALHKTMPL